MLGEVLCGDYFFKYGDKSTAAVFYFLFGIGISIVPLVSNIKTQRRAYKYTGAIFLCFWLAIICWSFAHFLYIIQTFPLDYKVADMLPVIEGMCKNALAFNSPYAPVTEVWDGWEPKYLPFMWMPFLPAVAFEFDVRWVCYFFVCGALTFIFLRISWEGLSIWSLLTLIPIGFLFYSLFFYDNSFFKLTQEGCIVAYYLLLAWALYTRSKCGLILGLIACLLSRYTLVIWAIMYCLVYIQNHKKEAVEIAWKVAVALVVLMICSGAIFHLDVFIDKQTNYVSDAQNPIHKWKVVDYMNRGLGMARLFEYDNLLALHKLFLAANFLIPAFCYFMYSKFKEKMNVSFFGICSLKLCLVFFFNLMIMPLKYLFYTSTFLSIIILLFYLNQKESMQVKAQ